MSPTVSDYGMTGLVGPPEDTVVLLGTRLILRIPSIEEVKPFLERLDDPETMRYMNIQDPVISREQMRMLPYYIRQLDTLRQVEANKRLRAIARQQRARGLTGHEFTHEPPPVGDVRFDVPFSIQRKDIYREVLLPVGIIVLSKINPLHKTAELRTVIFPEHRRRWYSVEAKRLVIRYGFEKLGLEKISSHFIDVNIATRKSNLACGLKPDCVLQRHVSVGGKRHDLVCMAVWKNDLSEILGYYQQHPTPQLKRTRNSRQNGIEGTMPKAA